MGDPIDTDRIRNLVVRQEVKPLALCDENDHLRYLLRRALPWIDPNDRHEDYMLVREIEEALR